MTMVDAAHSDTSKAFQTAVATESSANLFDGLHALEHAEAQIAFGFRPTGTKAAVKTGDYILQSLKDSGWEASEQPFDLNINGQTIRARNIIGTIGKGPVIIVGAHFDTRIFANADPDQNRRLEMVMGANDGASGVAVMLELARVLGQGYKLNREIRFVFFDAEDNGNIPGWPGWSLGAKHYAENLDVKPEYVIILDMIGDKDLNVYYEGQSMKNAPDLMTEIFQAAADLGYTDSFIPELRHTMIDDHVPFIERGIKAIDLIDFDYPYWHTVSDTLDKISAESMEKIGRTVQKYFEQSGVISPS
jgi:glutaminyl-peptide cyclotransferase